MWNYAELQARRAERSERNNDESAHRRSDGPVRVDSVTHIRSIRFNLLGRKSLYLVHPLIA